MRAAFITRPKKVELKEVPSPEPKADEVLVRVLYNAVCGSELPGYLGISTGYPHYRHEVNYPVGPFGHEAVGRVEKVGAEAGGFKKGDLVLAGGYYEYRAIPSDGLVKVPGGIAPKHAALAMAGLETLSAVEIMRASPKDEVLVLGAGPFGLMIVEHLREKGCESIVCGDIVKWRLGAARELGATGTIDVSEEPIAEGVKRLIPEGPTLSFDTTARAEPIRSLFKVTRRFGRIGFYARAVETSDNFEVEDMFHKQLEIRGLKCRDYSREIKERTLEMIRRNQLHGDKLITHVFPLEEINDAFELAAVKKEGLKVLVQCTPE